MSKIIVMEKVQGVEAGVAIAETQIRSQCLLCFPRNEGIKNDGEVMLIVKVFNSMHTQLP